jgi:hypothetical protein
MIPTIQEAEIGRILVQGQLEGEKVSETPSHNKPGITVHTCESSYVGGISRRIEVKNVKSLSEK